nr:hypothetical protein [Enterobacter roggenkampii]
MSFHILLRFACLLGACALSGCASLSSPGLTTCDGTARRPANPHGSVLSPDPTATPQAATTTKVDPSQTGGCA